MAGAAQMAGFHLGRRRTIGVEAFDTTAGTGFPALDELFHAVQCELVKDGAVFVAPRTTEASRPPAASPSMHRGARLTRDGDVRRGGVLASTKSGSSD